jgi:hypothetical protein
VSTDCTERVQLDAISARKLYDDLLLPSLFLTAAIYCKLFLVNPCSKGEVQRAG